MVTASTVAGAVTVQAGSALAAAPVTFNESNGLVNIPGLTPPELAVAGALDTACPFLATISNPTPTQADLLARCSDIGAAAGVDPAAAAYALGQLVSETAAVQSSAAVNAATAQFQNITLRLNALRSSSNTDSLASNNLSLAGLAFAGPGGVVPVTSLMGALLGDGDKPAEDKQAGSGFSRWGFFATGTIGSGSADARSLTPAYNFNINGLTAGVDYRQRDNWISGVAVGYSMQDTDLQNDVGHVSMTGWSLSTYSTWSFKNDLYLDGVLTWGNNSFDLTRRILYTLPTLDGGTTSIDQLATGHPGGSLFSAALTFGGDYHKNAWNFSPYAQLIASHMGFDGYDETMQAGLGDGLGLSVDSRSINTFSSVLGTKVSYTNSTSWGVLIPTASLEWQHEFDSDSNEITAHFINDPTQTPFSLLGNPLENSFVRFGLGTSFVMSHGRSGFILYEHTFGQDGIRQDNLGLGIRIEF
jgi:outer membrane autotransporter protein